MNENRNEENRNEEKRINKKQTRKKKAKPNKELMLITTMFSLAFFVMAGYLAYFLAFKSEETINNPYNQRQEEFKNKVVRGSILAKDGTVLAETQTDEEGNETRVYPFGSLFAHVVGYDTHGRSGIELLMNFNLLRSNINTLDYLDNEIHGKKNPGDNVTTTLDPAMQQVAYDALGSHDGAVVIMNAKTGEVSAMVSKPDFDPGSLEEEWDSLNEESSVLLNRATSGLYPPGSTFKILTLLEYIRENYDYESYRYVCEGTIESDDYYIQCHNLAVHGEEDLGESFAYSCNTSFVNIGMKLDIASYRKTAESLLFNKTLPTQFSVTKSSFDLTTEDGDFMKAQTVIGQGTTLVTPMHMAMIAASIANDGVLMKPYLVSKVESQDGKEVLSCTPEAYGELMSKREAGLMKGFMREVTTYGTASSLDSDEYEIYGKTGTAQFGSETNDHFWFCGFVEKDGETYAISVVIEDEEAYTNPSVAVVREILNAQFRR